MHCADALQLNVLRQEGWIPFEAPLRSALLDMQLRFTRKVHKSLALFVEVKARSYTVLIASDLRNVPNVLGGPFLKGPQYAKSNPSRGTEGN